jgi:hypothetical protein
VTIKEFLSVVLEFVTTSTIPSSVQEVGVFTTQLLVIRFVTVPSENFLSQILKTIALHFFLKVPMICSIFGNFKLKLFILLLIELRALSWRTGGYIESRRTIVLHTQ